jgi:hypothetical protein
MRLPRRARRPLERGERQRSTRGEVAPAERGPLWKTIDGGPPGASNAATRIVSVDRRPQAQLGA